MSNPLPDWEQEVAELLIKRDDSFVWAVDANQLARRMFALGMLHGVTYVDGDDWCCYGLKQEAEKIMRGEI